MRILVVEDDAVVREYLEMCLSDEGHAVVSVNSAESVFESGGIGFSFDLLVTDFNLGPGLDGVDLAEKFNKVSPDTRLLVISGEPMPARLKLHNRLGGNVLPKPFFKNDLLRAVERAFAEQV